MVEVIVDRLLDMAGIDREKNWMWPGSSSFSLEDVLTAKSDGVIGDGEPYGDTWKHPVKAERNMDYHIAERDTRLGDENLSNKGNL